MFRSLDKTSELGQRVGQYSSRGELVPDELTVELWQSYVQGLIDDGRYDPASHVLCLDGIPRSAVQAEMLDEHIEPLVILHLTAPSADEMVRRMKLRAEKEGRADDSDECVIRRRFEVYQRETAPVLEHYDPELVRRVDALGTIDEVFDRIQQALASGEPA
jgi:adenylate kinase